MSDALNGPIHASKPFVMAFYEDRYMSTGDCYCLMMMMIMFLKNGSGYHTTDIINKVRHVARAPIPRSVYDPVRYMSVSLVCTYLYA